MFDTDAKPPSDAVPEGESVSFAGPCGSNCYKFNVSVPGLPDIELQLEVTSPAGEEKGWILLCSGGNGTGFMGDQVGGRVLVEALVAQGYMVLDRRWVGGWIRSGFGVLPQSRRGAAMISFLMGLAEQQHKALRTIGNSAGSSELAYSLTTWKRYPVQTILCSGPPMSRLQYECPTIPPQAWVQHCMGMLATSGFVFRCGTPAFSNPNGFLCPLLFMPRFLPEDSILHSHAHLAFPLTVTMLIGDNDCTAAVCQALEFSGSTGVIPLLVGGGEHFLPKTIEGRNAILAELP